MWLNRRCNGWGRLLGASDPLRAIRVAHPTAGRGAKRRSRPLRRQWGERRGERRRTPERPDTLTGAGVERHAPNRSIAPPFADAQPRGAVPPLRTCGTECDPAIFYPAPARLSTNSAAGDTTPTAPARPHSGPRGADGGFTRARPVHGQRSDFGYDTSNEGHSAPTPPGVTASPRRRLPGRGAGRSARCGTSRIVRRTLGRVVTDTRTIARRTVIVATAGASLPFRSGGTQTPAAALNVAETGSVGV